MSRSPITTHVLDTSSGIPAKDIAITLSKFIGGAWLEIGTGTTNNDGRVTEWQAINDRKIDIEHGTYKLVFNLAQYFEKQDLKVFYPSAEITFCLSDDRHHHIPLLLSQHGYSTYRGS
ncbi:hydroxyisourate hydrolase [Paraglaciecola aquimarina]|uniref:5-hydroxyisourate hydrolase n=1 Tax=Paraglaciecola aquimarina TaxID=1235557 RepID=A0ABU3SYF8_9ALTE|nr:hydroxyisourate hydrolase [Paraglaciecola aquimarina]MDU0355049.1 hydroxyisourate hydrolase [Paraglaciecola aquimarina]